MVEKDIIKRNKIFLKKDVITFLILIFFDIVLVIYSARLNVINYAVVFDKEIFISKTSYLLLGRNYVNVIIIAFFYIYGCLINKFFLKRKNTKKFLFFFLLILIIINIMLFAIFTKKVF